MTTATPPTFPEVPGLPKTLKILGKRFKIRLLAEDEDVEADGSMDLGKQEITIRPKEALEQMQDTSLHEAIHAIDESLSLGLTESQVFQLAAGLLALLKDNRGYAKWLQTNDE